MFNLQLLSSTGNHNYAKGARMVIQLHDEWCQKYPDVVKEFFLEGHHVVRYTDGDWGGVWSDLCIEQTLMKNAKSSGGLAHGALRDHNVVKTWMMTVPHTSEVSDRMRPVYQEMKKKRKAKKAAPETTTSNGVISASEKRDRAILLKLIECFKDNSPFSTNIDPSTLVSLSSGMIDTTKCNPEKAEDVGESIQENLDGKPFITPVQRKDMIANLNTLKASVRVGDKQIDCNHEKLFTRLLLIGERECGVKDCLEYELTPYPLALYEPNGGVRSKSKSELGLYFRERLDSTGRINCLPLSGTAFIDGGWLLFQVIK